MTDADRYRALQTGLAEVAAEKTAPEAHGMLCGMLSTPGETEQARWIAEVLANTAPKGEPAERLLRALTDVFESTRTALGDGNLTFAPLLPPDDAPLTERATALGEWCEGFLFGLGLGGLTSRASLPSEAGEVVSDFGEIARVDAEADLGEAGESAYAELTEYVRMGALLVRENLVAAPGGSGAGGGRKGTGTPAKDGGKRRLH